MRALLIAASLALVARAACISVPHDRILASDISSAVPGLCLGDCASVLIGWAPQPGVARVLTRGELLRIAHTHGISLDPQEVREVCVQRATQPLREEAIRAALAAIPELAGAQIEITEFSRVSVPEGRPQFKLENLPHRPETAVGQPMTWRGRFVYDEGHTLPIWATVRLSVTRAVVRATTSIPAGTQITDAMVELAQVQLCPVSGMGQISSIADAVGKKASRHIAPGSILATRWLVGPDVISRGDKVQLTIESGGVRLRFETQAVSSAGVGQIIVLRQTGAPRLLRATAEGKGQAVLRVSGEHRSS